MSVTQHAIQLLEKCLIGWVSKENASKCENQNKSSNTSNDK